MANDFIPWPSKRPPVTRLDPIYLTIPEVARLLGLHRNTIARWIRDGGMPGVHLGPTGAVVRVPRKELYAWLEAQKRAGSTLDVDENTKIAAGESRT